MVYLVGLLLRNQLDGHTHLRVAFRVSRFGLKRRPFDPKNNPKHETDQRNRMIYLIVHKL